MPRNGFSSGNEGALQHKPMPTEYVWVHGCPGMYIVLRIDAENETADLLKANGIHAVERDVPFEEIVMCAENEAALPRMREDSETEERIRD